MQGWILLSTPRADVSSLADTSAKLAISTEGVLRVSLWEEEREVSPLGGLASLRKEKLGGFCAVSIHKLTEISQTQLQPMLFLDSSPTEATEIINSIF